MFEIELFDHLTVCIYKMYLQIIYFIYIYIYIYMYVCMYKKDLALNYQQWLICHKTQQTWCRWVLLILKVKVLCHDVMLPSKRRAKKLSNIINSKCIAPGTVGSSITSPHVNNACTYHVIDLCYILHNTRIIK